MDFPAMENPLQLEPPKSDPMIPKDILDQAFHDHHIYDCEVRRKDAFSFLLIKDAEREQDQVRRIVNVFLDENPRFGASTYFGFAAPHLAISRKPVEQAVMISLDGSVAVLGGGYDDVETNIVQSENGPLFGGAMNAATIDGFIYVAGGRRRICFREAPGKWTSIRLNLPDVEGRAGHVGFSALAGFSREDIYAVGGKGDAWRFDGEKWHRCPLPTNMYLESVCCAGDGHVYIGLQSGGLMRGRENSWEVIHEDTMTLPFKDMVWFDNRLWCTSDYGLWALDNGKLIEADVPPEVKACSGNLSTADGVMLLAGHYGAAVHDGKEWTRLL
jgi:hypothetical protein